jgi:hypothetical protein
MPIPDIGVIDANISDSDLRNEVAKLQKLIMYLLTNGLDTDNVNELNAKVIIAGSITAEKIAANSITANEIAANAITTSELQAGAVTADKISVSQLSAISANIGTVNAGSITANTTINVGTDATINNKLHMNPSNFGNGIDWGSIQIYIDPGASALWFSASGGVFANGKRIDI